MAMTFRDARMKRFPFPWVYLLLCAVVMSACAAGQASSLPATQGNVDLPRFPSISPDGSRIVFSWRGDLWQADSGGGQAIRLTRHNGEDLRSAWSSDGSKIAFSSRRSGYLNLHLMNADGTDIRQLTQLDRNCILAGFGRNEAGEEVVLFGAHLEGEFTRSMRPYSVGLEGGEVARVHDALGSHPVVSPSGRYVAFTRGTAPWNRRRNQNPNTQNVWVYDRQEQTFTQVTDSPFNDGHARWRSEEELLYLSGRELDAVNLYRVRLTPDMDSDGFVHERLTSFTEADIQDFDLSGDGDVAVFVVWDQLYRYDLRSGSEPTPLAFRASTDMEDNFRLQTVNRAVSEAALSPDGKVMAVVAYGEIFIRHVDDNSPTVRVTNSAARKRDIVWSPDGVRLYFVSNRDGADSIYYATVAMTRSDITEQFAQIAKLAEEAEQAASEPTAQAGAVQGDEADVAVETGEANHDEASDDEPAAEPTTAEPSEPAAAEPEAEEPAESEPDAAQPSEADAEKLYDPKRWHDAIRFEVHPLVVAESSDDRPSPSPNGRYLAFLRSPGHLMLLDLVTGEERVLRAGWDFRAHWRWSPDGRHLALAQADRNYNYDIWIVPIDGSFAPVNISRHPVNEFNPRWSADGRILSFLSQRVQNQYDVYSVYLDSNLEALSSREREQHYSNAARAARQLKPIAPVRYDRLHEAWRQRVAAAENEANADEDADADDAEAEQQPRDLAPMPRFTLGIENFDLDDAYLRLRRLTTTIESESNNEITPAGDRYIFRTGNALFSVKWDGSDRKRLAGGVNVQHLTIAGDQVIFVESGRAGMVPVNGGNVKYIDIADRIEIDLEQFAEQKFLEVAHVVGERFYNSEMNGQDWHALTQRYLELARRTRTVSEFSDVANRLMGELNGSHLGVSPPMPAPPNRRPYGRLGTLHERVEDGYRVTHVVRQSPAAKGPMALEVGDVITAIELEPFEPTDTVESRLQGRIGEETIITIRRPVAGQMRSFNVLMHPISYTDFARLRYEEWRLNNAALVEAWSGGRIGYLHIERMNEPSLQDFERDLFAAAGDKQGLIIDVRDNGGGWIADRLLASIMVQPHAYTVPRGADPDETTNAYPQDRLFIQRYTLPINALCNENSFSNAEIFSHAFKTLNRGTLVGQQTAGGVISTSSHRLVDGTTVRIPHRGWYLFDGTDMENNGAIPDILLPQTPESEVAGNDEQLRVAVEDLLKRLPDPTPAE